MPLREGRLPQDVLNENRGLKRKLNTLLSDARKNENTLRRFQSLELRLLGCHSLSELMQMLVHHSHKTFGWDRVTMMLHDRDYEIRRLLEQMGGYADNRRELILVDKVDSLVRLYGTPRRPRLGAYNSSTHGHMFPGAEKPLASVAILPLERGGRLLGSLNLGSADGTRFQKGTATDFLEHLSAVIAVCVETTLIQERLKHAGLTDALTGVSNRRYFDQRLIEEVARSLRSNQKLSCLFIDVDHFKQINDTYGHPVGDLALQDVAKLIRGQLRSTDVVARYGGEEFAVLLAQANNDLAVDIAERIRDSVDSWDFRVLASQRANVTVSIGVATLEFTSPEDDPRELGQELVNVADNALYRAKREGRNRVINGNMHRM